MYNDILTAVTRSLDELFPDRTIYTEAVEQGLQEPCFFINLLEPNEKQMMGQRYFRSTGLCVQYLPGPVEKPSRELNRVADILFNILEYVDLLDGAKLKGTNMSCKFSDGVLSFFVHYNMFILKPKEQEKPMEELENDINMKG